MPLSRPSVVFLMVMASGCRASSMARGICGDSSTVAVAARPGASSRGSEAGSACQPSGARMRATVASGSPERFVAVTVTVSRANAAVFVGEGTVAVTSTGRGGPKASSSATSSLLAV